MRSGHTWVIRSPYSCCLRGCCTVLDCGGSYLYIWAILAVAAWLFRKMESRLGWGLLCGFYGLIFGTLTAIPVLILSGPAATLAYIISGIPFDLIHGVSNFLLAFLLLPTLRRVLARLTRSLNMGTLYFE